MFYVRGGERERENNEPLPQDHTEPRRLLLPVQSAANLHLSQVDAQNNNNNNNSRERERERENIFFFFSLLSLSSLLWALLVCACGCVSRFGSFCLNFHVGNVHLIYLTRHFVFVRGKTLKKKNSVGRHHHWWARFCSDNFLSKIITTTRQSSLARYYLSSIYRCDVTECTQTVRVRL
jgi:hypothetical protein